MGFVEFAMPQTGMKCADWRVKLMLLKSPWTVLLIDDFKPFRQFVNSELERRGKFRVVGQASTGLECIQKAQSLRPDVILLDIGLPDLNGINVARRLHKLVPDSRILMLSQESSFETVQTALSSGASGYVHKTRAGRELLTATATVLEGKRFVGSNLEGCHFATGDCHEILFCSDDTAIVDGLGQFIASALSTGNAAIVWATESHRSALVRKLLAEGVNAEAALQDGTFISSDITEPPDPARILATITGLREAAFKAGHKHPRVAICGERAGWFWAEGRANEAIRLEQMFNDLARKIEIDILCMYPSPLGREEEHDFKGVCAEHSAIHFG